MDSERTERALISTTQYDISELTQDGDVDFPQDPSQSFTARRSHNRNFRPKIKTQIQAAPLVSTVENVHNSTPKFAKPFQQRTLRKSNTLVFSNADSESPLRKRASMEFDSPADSPGLQRAKSVLFQDKEGDSEQASPTKFQWKDDLDSFAALRASFRRQSEGLSVAKSLGREDSIDMFEDHNETKEKAMRSRAKIFIHDCLESKYAHTVVAFFTLYALFADNIRILADTRAVDVTFDILSIVTFIIFVLEIVLTWYVDKEYFCSFFFWLDFISTISLIFDVEFLLEDLFPSELNNSAQVAEASRASRIATKQGRVAQIARLVQLAKFYNRVNKTQEDEEPNRTSAKVYPLDAAEAPSEKQSQMPDQAQEIKLKSDNSTANPKIEENLSSSTLIKIQGVEAEYKEDQFKAENQQNNPVPNKQEKPPKELRVGKKLSELTTKRVIVIVLALLLLIPLFYADFYHDSPSTQEFQMVLFERLFDNENVSATANQLAIDIFIQQHLGTHPSLVYLKIGGDILYAHDEIDLNHLKGSQTKSFKINTKRGEIFSVFSSAETAKIDSALGIGRIVFVCFVLVFGAMLFNKDANELLIHPLERIIKKVNEFAKNPFLVKEDRLVEEKMQSGFQCETFQIENAITKIGKLLTLGFGETGSIILALNVGTSGDINPILPGEKNIAIFASCNIPNFEHITQILQEDVVVFVNSIAAIVHTTVDKYGGAVSKTIGSAFELVWRLSDDAIFEHEDGTLEILDPQVIQNITDCALLSLLKIYAKINRDPTLLRFIKHLNHENFQRFEISLGLHAGWAIEGTIGSQYLIDTSYFSSNVGLSSHLGLVTKQYGVSILLSGDVHGMLSNEFKDKTRMIDVIEVKGSSRPLDLYTIDIDISEFPPLEPKANLSKKNKKLKHIQKKTAIKQIIENGEAHILISEAKKFRKIFKDHRKEFIDCFHDGINFYVDGDWPKAKEEFEACLKIESEDGPSQSLLKLMAKNNYVAPNDWKGFRNLAVH